MFTILLEAVARNELILIDGGICRFHCRKDGICTIREILSLIPGQGSVMLEKVKVEFRRKGCYCIFAKCPEYLKSNQWWKKKGFSKIDEEEDSKGNVINCWELQLI